ncbi:artemin-like [Phyllostomus hastatus]|uniref:artemin-like n=1 Tax=Phyllostomus hastatus TaxID=9423 RepID=UPI001E681B8F|nr:artemin-like [Phyllostomus hastatus]
MARVPAGAEGDAPSSPPETLPRSVGEDSRFPAQGYLLSGAEPSPPAPRPFSGQPRPPPSAAPQQPLSAAPPGGLRERLESRESCRTRDPRPMQRVVSGLLGAGHRDDHPASLPVCVRCVPGLGFPGSCRLLRHHPCLLLPAALPLHLHPAPARACVPPPPLRTGLFPGLRLSGTNPGRSMSSINCSRR